MKIAYVTALFPFAPVEPFFEPEVRALAQLAEVHVVATRAKSRRSVYPPLGARMHALRAFDRATLAGVAREVRRDPQAVARAFGRVVAGPSSWRARLVNAIVFPKALSLADLVRQRGIEHVHAQWLTTPSTLGYVASLLTGVPFSVSAHQHDIFAGNLTARKVERARFVRVISDRNRRHLEALLPASLAERCVTVHLGVDVPETIAEPYARTPRILCAARLCAWKGHRYLLAALAQLRDRGVPFQCDLAGDGELRAQVARDVLRFDLGDRVRMIGNVPHGTLVASLARGDYDLFALASTERPGEHEGIPVAAMEAMAAAIPVVSTRTGSLDELLDDGNGRLVQQRNAAALAAAIDELLADAELRRRLGAAARERVTAAFSSTATTRRLAELLEIGAPAGVAGPIMMRR